MKSTTLLKSHVELGKAESNDIIGITWNYTRAQLFKLFEKSMKSIELFVKCRKTFRGLALIAKNFMSKCRSAGTLMEGSGSFGCMSLYPLLG